MPVKDAARYLPRCLDSILAQSLKDWQLLVVDDGSTDGSFDLLRTYAERDARILPTRNEGRGIIAALRQGYSLSEGGLITRMDADDYMPPQKLERMSAALADAGRGHLAVGLVEYFSDSELGDGYRRYAEWLNHLTAAARNFEEIYKECVIPSPCWMVHREDLEACGAFRPDVYPEDYDLCFRFYERGLRVLPIREILHYWRDHAERSSRNDPHYADNRFANLKLDYFAKLDYDSTRPLFLWGAGGKGKRVARGLLGRQVAFRWLCDNPRKVGKDIYGVRMEHYNALDGVGEAQVIVAVSAPDGQKEVRNWLSSRGLWGLFFC